MRGSAGWASIALLALAGCGGSTSQEATQQLTGAALSDALRDANVVLLDVREPSELEELGTVEGYVNIPIDQLEGRLEELPRDKPILTA